MMPFYAEIDDFTPNDEEILRVFMLPLLLLDTLLFLFSFCLEYCPMMMLSEGFCLDALMYLVRLEAGQVLMALVGKASASLGLELVFV